MPRHVVAIAISLIACVVPLRAADPPNAGEAAKALKQFQIATGLQGRVWATEPLLHNPVCFAFDARGRCFVAETYRLHHGVTDNRKHMYWLEDDVASRTVEDRVAMHKKHAKEAFASTYEKDEDRVKLVWDSDGDGRADQSSIFADGFRTAASGIGSGLLARNGDVYYANIPDLWLLRDTRSANKADVRESLSYGYGVHVAFLGHDSHGLVMGPDGRIYFSIGDRGLNVKNKEGRHLFNPDSGAVLRMEPDGSKLEIVHRGLRNPQELAFDNYGNLFTVDNNSDSGDRARLVQIVEGGDSGWRMFYQYGSSTSNRGPWNAEKLWHLAPDNTGAYNLPPLAHFTDGPSGLCFNPGGAAMPEKYNDHFFVCDFRGGADNSGVWAFTVKPRGASFELDRKEHLVWRILATDCDFGPDGGFYISDWVQGWDQPEKGRIHRFADPAAEKKPVVAEVKKLLAEGFDKRSNEVLAKLLEHADRRVRQEAQFALAARGDKAIEVLANVARKQVQTPTERFARLHAIWALGQLGRAGINVTTILQTCAGDHDSEIRAQAVRTMGDVAVNPTLLAPALKDAESRVKMFAALAIARSLSLKAVETNGTLVTAVLDLLRENNDQDSYVRHAGVTALANLHPETISAANEPPAVRLAVVLALRQSSGDGNALIPFLHDTDPRVQLEAARALHDAPDAKLSPETTKHFAALLKIGSLPEAVLYRALNMMNRAGSAGVLASYAATQGAPEKLRLEAIAMLGDWARPKKLDRVLGDYRPLADRDPAEAAKEFRPRLGAIFAGNAKIRAEAAKVAAKLGIREVAGTLRQIVTDSTQSASARVDALKALDALKDKDLESLLPVALKSESPAVRARALCMTALRQPSEAVATLSGVLDKGEMIEQQAALETLADLKRPDADAYLAELLDRWANGKLRDEIKLDLREAAARRNTPLLAQKLTALDRNRPADDPLWRFREALVGGNWERGRDVFLNKAEVTCVKCHKLNGVGGEVGPELAGIAKLQKREYLLESLVLPDKQIAKGFDSVVLELKNGKTVTGVLKGEDAANVRIMTAEAQLLTVPKAQIDDRRRGVSAMPDDLVKKMSLRELRDLVEFLAGLK